MSSCYLRFKKSFQLFPSSSIVLILLLCVSNGVGAQENKPDDPGESNTRLDQLKRIGFVCAGLPWMPGSDHAQGDSLMKSLKETFNYDTYWMMRGSRFHDISPGIYSGNEISRLVPQNIPKMPHGWDATHLSFLTLPKRTKVTKFVSRVQPAALSISELNGASKKYGIDAWIVLGDISDLYQDAYDFVVPVIGWVPYHYNTVRGADRALLRPYTYIVGLAPSTTKIIKDVRPNVAYVPHIIDGLALEVSAKKWLKKQRQLRSNENKSDREIVFDARQYDMMFNRTSESFSAVKTPDSDEEDVFVILVSGTNYQDADSKGWDVAIQAFVKFHEIYPNVKKHLWIHSFLPNQVMRNENEGMDLRGLIQEMDLPPEMYTLDIGLHPRGRIAALKMGANVCLHPSKAGGFGMDVLECQSVGTPVVTTEFGAMYDFTKNGISVPPAQWENSLSGQWATPDVKGVAEALGVVAKNRNSDEWLQKSKDSVEWIQEEFSVANVAKGFNRALHNALTAHTKNLSSMLTRMAQAPSFAQRPMFHITNDEHPRMAEWDEEWVLYHRPDVRVNYEMVQTMLHELTTKKGQMVSALFVICKDVEGVPIKVSVDENEYDGIHRTNTEHPVLLPTWAFAQAQGRFPYIHNAVLRIVSNSEPRFVKILPPGSAQRIRASEIHSTRDDEL